MSKHDLTFNTRKALSVHLGEGVSNELAQTLSALLERVEQLEAEVADLRRATAPETPTFTIRRAA